MTTNSTAADKKNECTVSNHYWQQPHLLLKTANNFHKGRNPQQESTYASVMLYCACLRLRRFDIDNPLENWINSAEQPPQPVLGVLGSVKSAGRQ